MDMASEETTIICTHCKRNIPSLNIDLHIAHCARNLEKCMMCGDMIPKKGAEEHFHSVHAPVACSLCSETMDRENLAVHKCENCPQRIITCEYCEFPLPAVDLFEHQDVCGNRTENCYRCGKYVRLRDQHAHETTCNSLADNAGGSSSRDARHVPEREARPQRVGPPPFPRSRLFFTVAVTGIAFIVGSFFLQKNSDSSLSP